VCYVLPRPLSGSPSPTAANTAITIAITIALPPATAVRGLLHR